MKPILINQFGDSIFQSYGSLEMKKDKLTGQYKSRKPVVFLGRAKGQQPNTPSLVQGGVTKVKSYFNKLRGEKCIWTEHPEIND